MGCLKVDQVKKCGDQLLIAVYGLRRSGTTSGRLNVPAGLRRYGGCVLTLARPAVADLSLIFCIVLTGLLNTAWAVVGTDGL